MLLFVAVAASSHAGSNTVLDADGSRISVTAVAGDVDFTMAGSPVAVAPNTTVLLPARIVTGHDGTVGLTQAGTNVNVASDTDVEIPAEAVDGNLIARMVQHRGNVFYDVAPRDLGKLRVETPLLVAVIKGTQFNVAVQPDSTTISLFEGRLEIRTPDSSDVVQLNAGEIAIRSLIDSEIRVVGMDDDRVAAPRAARPAVAAARAATAPSVSMLADGSGSVDVGLDTSVDLGAAALDLGLDTGADLGAGAVDLGVDTSVDLGADVVDAAVDVGLDLDLADGTLDLGLGGGGTDPAETTPEPAPAPPPGGLLGGLLGLP